MKLSHLFAAAGIVACAAAGWFLLAATLNLRTRDAGAAMHKEVADIWGPPLTQAHPVAWFETPNTPSGRMETPPTESAVSVHLTYEPKRRGLVWHRTYGVKVITSHTFTNPTKIPQTIYVAYPLPESSAGLTGFEFRLGDGADAAAAELPGPGGIIHRAVRLDAGASVRLHTSYITRGSDTFRYHFPDNRRVSGFKLAMTTDFADISFPAGTASPSDRKPVDGGYSLEWNYPDILAAPDIGMDMPAQLNAGPVAARIAFFAPVSLVFFVTVLLLLGGVRRIPLHPMHVFFVAAGFFAFHLLFAYLVDLISLPAAFGAATAVSLLLVSGYLHAVGGRRLLWIALPAQLLYLVVFSASFFLDGLTGLTLTVLGIVTLALLMWLTAKVDWRDRFARRTPLPAP